MGNYLLTMHCVSGDGIQVSIHRREDVKRWLIALDHEGAVWDVVQHIWDPEGTHVAQTIDISDEAYDSIP